MAGLCGSDYVGWWFCLRFCGFTGIDCALVSDQRFALMVSIVEMIGMFGGALAEWRWLP